MPLVPEEHSKLLALARSNGPLDEEETNYVMRQADFFVLADDEPLIQRVITRMLMSARKDITKLTGSVKDCFGSLSDTCGQQGSLILCQNGSEAWHAARMTAEKGLSDGIFVFDQNMGSPQGLDVFREFFQALPPRIARVLFCGIAPDDCDENLENGVLDAVIEKRVESPAHFRATLARAYLKRLLRETAK